MKESSAFTLLQRGNHSQIFLHGDNLVLKMVDVTHAKQARHLRNEYQLLSGIKHPNVIRVMSYKQNIPIKGCSRDVLIMEYARQGSLLNYLKKPVSLNQRILLVRQLVGVVQYLHTIQHVAHRDIKLDNLLVKGTQPTLLISDFGFATKKQNNDDPFNAHSYKGTRRGYMAPEMHRLLTSEALNYDPTKIDVFSVGVVIFSIMFDKLPFQASVPTDSYYSLLKKEDKQSFWTKHKLTKELYPDFPMLQQFRHLLENMWIDSPQHRWSMKRVEQAQWIKFA